MDNEIFFALSIVISYFGWRITHLLRELIKVSTEKEMRFPYHYLDTARTTMGYSTEANPNYWLLLAIISLLSNDEF